MAQRALPTRQESNHCTSRSGCEEDLARRNRLLNLFMKRFTRERVVPIISASGS
jgi:hypothetical protein